MPLHGGHGLVGGVEPSPRKRHHYQQGSAGEMKLDAREARAVNELGYGTREKESKIGVPQAAACPCQSKGAKWPLLRPEVSRHRMPKASMMLRTAVARLRRLLTGWAVLSMAMH